MAIRVTVRTCTTNPPKVSFSHRHHHAPPAIQEGLGAYKADVEVDHTDPTPHQHSTTSTIQLAPPNPGTAASKHPPQHTHHPITPSNRQAGNFPTEKYSPYKMSEKEEAIFMELVAPDKGSTEQKLSATRKKLIEADEYETIKVY